jgi:hypothetical protein
MKPQFKMREVALAIAAITTVVTLTPAASAADKASTKAAGTYVTGDFHNHSTCSDGSLSLKKLVDKSVNTWKLDWFVQADHGGRSARNCTLAEDPFEPVAPALGLTNSATGPWQASPPVTYPGAGQPASALKGPNQTWESTVGLAAIKGDGTATPKQMWRWQEIKEYQYKVLETLGRDAKKPVWIGLEQNNPGHEHTSMAVLKGQAPWPSTAAGFSPTARNDRPSGVRYSSQATAGTSSKAGGAERLRPGIRVGVEPTAATGADGFDPVEVRHRVHTLEIGAGGGLGSKWCECFDQPLALHPGQHGTKPLGTLGMARPGEVLEIGGVGTEQHGHGPDATVEP